MRASFGLRSRARQLSANGSKLGGWGLLLALVPLLSIVYFGVDFVNRRAGQQVGSRVLRTGASGALDRRGFAVHSKAGMGSDNANGHMDTDTVAASRVAAIQAAAAGLTARETADHPSNQGSEAGSSTRRPALRLFLAWTGTAPLQVGEFERLLADILSQTASPRVHLHFLLDDSHMGGTQREAVQALLGRCRALAAARSVRFGWVITSVQAFEAASGIYRRLCADFKANVSPGAQAYTCHYLIKPLMWELDEQARAAAAIEAAAGAGGGGGEAGDGSLSIPPRAGDSDVTVDGIDYSGIVLALDTDLRIAGDITDLLLQHVGPMRARGASFALTEEQQPTYAFNSPQKAQGFNGGVQLIDVVAMAASELYRGLVSEFTWAQTDPRWRPATDLGDQTLYSVLNFTNPALFHPLGCEWNRQMCRIWFTFIPGRDRTSKEDFIHYEGKALCPPPPGGIRVLHGNCKSNRPGSEELAGLPDAWQPRNDAAEGEMLAAYERMKETPEYVLQGKPPPAPALALVPEAAAAAAAPKL